MLMTARWGGWAAHVRPCPRRAEGPAEPHPPRHRAFAAAARTPVSRHPVRQHEAAQDDVAQPCLPCAGSQVGRPLCPQQRHAGAAASLAAAQRGAPPCGGARGRRPRGLHRRGAVGAGPARQGAPCPCLRRVVHGASASGLQRRLCRRHRRAGAAPHAARLSAAAGQSAEGQGAVPQTFNARGRAHCTSVPPILAPHLQWPLPGTSQRMAQQAATCEISSPARLRSYRLSSASRTVGVVGVPAVSPRRTPPLPRGCARRGSCCGAQTTRTGIPERQY